MFRPAPDVQRIPLGDMPVCVVDDALDAPDRWIELACRHADGFVPAARNAYPGVELPMPDSIVAQCKDFIDQTFRGYFGVRRTLHGHMKLAMATQPDSMLQPFQMLPHVDRQDLGADEVAMAWVLYLFKDARFGGTSFYRPRVDSSRLATLFADAACVVPDEFSARHGIPRRYPSGTTECFEHVLSLPPRWNRLVVYPGTIFHSAEIPQASALSADPATGRLTLNGFFTCKRSLLP